MVKKNFPLQNKKLLVFHNPDKLEFHEKPDLDNGFIGHPVCVSLMGKPNSGKSSVILNLIINQKVPFDRIICCHYLAGVTKEYELIDCEMRDDLIDVEDIDPEQKTLLIIEDMPVSELNKDERKKLNRICGCLSSHGNMSVYITSQNITDLDVSIRRMCQVFMIWNYTENSTRELIVRLLGSVDKKEIDYIFNNFKSIHDFLVICRHCRPTLRKNIFEVLRD